MYETIVTIDIERLREDLRSEDLGAVSGAHGRVPDQEIIQPLVLRPSVEEGLFVRKRCRHGHVADNTGNSS